MRPTAVLTLLVLAACADAAGAASWQLSAGATVNDGGAVEVSRRTARWEVALGYLGAQTVTVRYLTPACPWQGAPAAACSQSVQRARESVDPYAYLSVQRRFALRSMGPVRPVLGFGVVGQSDTNEYVSSAVNFSLSAGVEIGERLTLQWRHFSNAGLQGPNLGQDVLLLRWTLR